jgi:DNA-binding MarR family transcriptional regulator
VRNGCGKEWLVTDTTADRPGYLIKRVQALLHDAMAHALARHQLTVTQYSALLAIEEEPGLSNAELARRAFVTPQSMHTVLHDLESRGLVGRQQHPQHGRVLQAALTTQGRRVLSAARGQVDRIEDRMLSGLSAQAQGRLATALRTCVEALAAADDGE